MLADPPLKLNKEALRRYQSIAFFCSQSCPGDVILKAQDWANTRGPEDGPVISGFHTQVERDVLRILLRGKAPVIYTLARAVEGARLPTALRIAEKEGRALILSPFAASVKRTTSSTSEQRNRYILTHVSSVLFAHASNGGKTEILAAEALTMGLPIFTMQSPSNAHLISMGAKPISALENEQ